MTETTETTPALDPKILKACEIAMGRAVSDPDDDYEVVACKKDLNSKGRGAHWYRMRVHRDGTSSYLTSRRMLSGQYLDAERRQTIKEVVSVGDLLIDHDKGGPINDAWLAVDGELVRIDWKKARNKKLRLLLPNGEEVMCENPRD